MLLIHSGFIRSRAFNKLYYIKMSPALLIGGKIDFVTAFFKPLADFVRSIIVIIKNTGDCTAYNWCRHGCSAFGGISIFFITARCDIRASDNKFGLKNAIKSRTAAGIKCLIINRANGNDKAACAGCGYAEGLWTAITGRGDNNNAFIPHIFHIFY